MTAEIVTQDKRTVLPVTRWRSVQFTPAVKRKREAVSVALPCFRTISEAHVSAREAALARRISFTNRNRRSRAGVRFRTTMSSQTDTW